MAQCINGCTGKPRDGGESPPKEAKWGFLCGGCYSRLRDWLRDIPVDYALLGMVKAASTGQRWDGAGRTKQWETPVPPRLDVLALTMIPRGYSGIREPGDELWYELPDVPSVVGVLHTWAETLRCDLDPYRDFQDLSHKHTVPGEIKYLLTAVDRLAEAKWVDEAMAEIQTVWVWLTRVHGLLRGDALGHCLTVPCDGKVYRDKFTGFPECNVCHRSYVDALDQVKVKLSEAS